MTFRYLLLLACFLVAGCSLNHEPKTVLANTPKLAAAENIVNAVNNKDVSQYAKDLHTDVIVKMYDGEIRLKGRAAVIENRKRHFESNSNAKNLLIHLVEIDDRVIMHDQVWLNGNTEQEPSEIVEIFTFKDNEIIQIDVIQPADLFANTRSD